MLTEITYPSKATSGKITFVFMMVFGVTSFFTEHTNNSQRALDSLLVCSVFGWAIGVVAFSFFDLEKVVYDELILNIGSSRGRDHVWRMITLTIFSSVVWCVPIALALFIGNKASTSMMNSPIIFLGWLLITGAVITLIPNYCWLMRKIHRRING